MSIWKDQKFTEITRTIDSHLCEQSQAKKCFWDNVLLHLGCTVVMGIANLKSSGESDKHTQKFFSCSAKELAFLKTFKTLAMLNKNL